MEYRLSNTNIGSLSAENLYNYSAKAHATIFKRFINWCDAQESNRFLWLGVIFFVQIGLALPLTACSIVFFANNSSALWITVLIVNLPNLVLNLAALKTRITLPFLFFAWFIELSIMLYAAISFLIIN